MNTLHMLSKTGWTIIIRIGECACAYSLITIPLLFQGYDISPKNEGYFSCKKIGYANLFLMKVMYITSISSLSAAVVDISFMPRWIFG